MLNTAIYGKKITVFLEILAVYEYTEACNTIHTGSWNSMNTGWYPTLHAKFWYSRDSFFVERLSLFFLAVWLYSHGNPAAKRNAFPQNRTKSFHSYVFDNIDWHSCEVYSITYSFLIKCQSTLQIELISLPSVYQTFCWNLQIKYKVGCFKSRQNIQKKSMGQTVPNLSQSHKQALVLVREPAVGLIMWLRPKGLKMCSYVKSKLNSKN